MTKHEWRKHEKTVYIPKSKPELIELPAYKFISLSGSGNPNSPEFSDCITALYTAAYGLKMTAKKPDRSPEGHYDYTVYPLEGVWDITDEAKKNFSGKINKDDLVFTLMLRQPDFIQSAFYEEVLEEVKAKKSNPLLNDLVFEEIEEGRCIQMLHIGPFDDEPASFEKMEEFAHANGLERLSKIHREIYLSDFRRTAPERLKTVLRFQLK